MKGLKMYGYSVVIDSTRIESYREPVEYGGWRDDYINEFSCIMKKKVIKPRNPLVVPLMKRSGGSHRKSNKIKRKGVKMQTIKELNTEGWNG